ncbi:hypothetical protein [Micromonospora chersina]|uniref:hypothetical protein n=1 Tax=Micromonospora chersina TaxID=47854 RepID=UPI0036830ED0
MLIHTTDADGNRPKSWSYAPSRIGRESPTEENAAGHPYALADLGTRVSPRGRLGHDPMARGEHGWQPAKVELFKQRLGIQQAADEIGVPYEHFRKNRDTRHEKVFDACDEVPADLKQIRKALAAGRITPAQARAKLRDAAGQ